MLSAASGATLSNFTATSAGEVISGSQVYSGTTIDDTAVLSGTWSAVSTASGTVYESGSAVLSGPVMLAYGATLDVESGAVASGVQSVSGGVMTVKVLSGGELLSSTINNGYVYVSSGGVTSGDVFNSPAGSVYLGGSSVDDTYNVLYGDGNDTFSVASGGTLADATVSSGMTVNAASGATVTGATVSSAGVLSAASGANLQDVSVASGGSATISGPYGSGTSSNLTFPVLETTLSGTWSAVNTASGTVYESGATVVSGPVSLANGAKLVVESSATASGVDTVSGGIATVVVDGGGELLSSYIQNGYVSVNSGGITSGNLFNSDPIYLSSGASSVDDTIYNSGYGDDTTYVSSGATIINPDISSGGIVSAYTGADVVDPAVNSGGSLTIAGAQLTETTLCFYPGTRLKTRNGCIPVEAVSPGMSLLNSEGEEKTVVWVGRSEVSTRFADPLRVLPIRVKADALGAGLPERDLLLSPDHAIFLEGILVQAGALVNGVSVVRDSEVPETFTYYHIELATHELLVAEGVWAESFVDNVDRMHFSNWAERTAPIGDIIEMPYPRAKSARQVPARIKALLLGGDFKARA